MSEPNTDLEWQPIVLQPGPVKRFISVSILFLLGSLLIYLGLAFPATLLIWQVFLLVLGGVFLFVAEKMRRATAVGLILLADRIEDSDGMLICQLDDVAGVERGAFAFKPSNGFSLRTRTPGPLRWAPGMWWRLGRRIGVGGITPAGPAKFMAELISQHVKKSN